MTISVTIRPQGSSSGGTTASVAGEGEIDTQEEALAALNAAGATAKISVFIVGDVQRSYAQIVGFMRLGPKFWPNGTSYASQSNAILRDAAKYDNRATTPAPVSVVVITEQIKVAGGASYMISPAATPLTLTQGADGVVGKVVSNQKEKKVWLKIDNDAETGLALPTVNTAASIIIPKTQLDALSVGVHTVSIRPDGGTSVWNIPFTVKPAAAKLNTSVVPGTDKKGKEKKLPKFFTKETLDISVTSDITTTATIFLGDPNTGNKVASLEDSVKLNKGANPLILFGSKKPNQYTTGTYDIVIQPEAGTATAVTRISIKGKK